MTLTLNLEGLLPEEKAGAEEKPVNSNYRHTFVRKPIGLNFTNANKHFATALSYWQKNKLATPLFWCVFDSLTDHDHPRKANKKMTPTEVINTLSPTEYAEELLEKLRNQK